MGLFDLFRNKSVDTTYNYLKQLVRVAKADGVLEKSEYDFILRVATRLEASEEMLEKIKQEETSNAKVDFQSMEDRSRFIWDLVWVMAVDNDIDVNEVHICSRIADKLGFNTEIVRSMAEFIHQHRNPNNDAKTDYQQIFEAFMKPDPQ